MNFSSRLAGVVGLDERAIRRDLYLDLVGPLRLSDDNGADFTPRGRKAQGLLALIGTSSSLRRARPWLQDKLWSDRGQEQGSGSLRQCLCEIRCSLGKYVDCLKAEAGWIGLDAARVQVRIEAPTIGVGSDAEFLEGLDIRDREFEHWLRDQRALYSERLNRDVNARVGDEGLSGSAARSMSGRLPLCRTRTVLGLAADQILGGRDDLVAAAEVVLDLVARSLLERADIDLMDCRATPTVEFPPATLTEPDLLLRASSSIREDRVRVTLRLLENGERRLLWTDVAVFQVGEFYEPDHAALCGLANRAVGVVMHHTYVNS
jgi:hypothetical protein